MCRAVGAARDKNHNSFSARSGKKVAHNSTALSSDIIYITTPKKLPLFIFTLTIISTFQLKWPWWGNTKEI